MIMIRLFVFPQIQELMPNIHQSTFLTRNFRLIKYFLIGIILLTGISFVYWFRQSPIRKVQLLIKLPLIGKLFQNYVAYYLASNLATLLKSGLSVREISITLAEFDKGSLIYSLGAKLDAALTDGQSLTDVVDEAQFVPDEIIKFLNSGDPITEMANAMTAYSSLMFEEMILTTNKIIGFIQPSMFIVIGITIVGTYFQLLTPIYNGVKGMY
jgi:competence protein ComGB